jgi:hypothetical protein
VKHAGLLIDALRDLGEDRQVRGRSKVEIRERSFVKDGSAACSACHALQTDNNFLFTRGE